MFCCILLTDNQIDSNKTRAMFTNSKIMDIYYLVDEFCKEFDQSMKKGQIESTEAKKSRNRTNKLSISEMITILILFHSSGYRCFKHFYKGYVQKHLTHLFPETLSYHRFVALQPRTVLPMTLFLKLLRKGEVTGISFIDSTRIAVCHNKRIGRNKVFRGIAKIGKSTMGWFFGFKLHVVINDKGEIINFMVTPANVDDREPLKSKNFIKDLAGKIFGDKGYVSKALFENLFIDGIQLITTIKDNMKNTLMPLADKIMLRKRSVIETVNDQLKNICQVEHSRHRSFNNFFSNLMAGLITYSFFDKKPAIKHHKLKTNQLAIF